MGESAGAPLGFIPRARLLDKLAGPHRLVHVRAPAGFGKSILLDQFVERLKEEGKRFVRFDLPRNPEANSALQNLLSPSEESRPGECGALRELLRDPDGAVLLVDGADHLDASPEIRVLMEGLIQQPCGLRVVFASRGEIGLSLARHEASGNLLRIPPPAVLFDKEEQAALLRPLEGEFFAAFQARQVFDSLGGWALGLGLQARTALEGFHLDPFGANDASARTVKGSWRLIEDYFQQEVMSALPDEVASFLIKASILQTVKVEDCSELFDGDGGELLQVAYRQGAPLWPFDPEQRSYALLPVFQQFLRARLDQREAGEIGRKACGLLERRNDYCDASMLALEIGEHARAAQLIERQLQTEFGLRDETRLLPLAERIDPKVRSSHPRILLAESQYLIFKFEFEQARRLLEQARMIIEERAGEEGVDPQEVRALEMLVLHREMVLALGQHDLAAAQDFGSKLLSGMQDVPPMQRVMLLASLIYAQQELYIFRGADLYYAQAKKLVLVLDSWIWSVPLETFYARHLFQTGRTIAAIELLEATLAKLVEELGPRPVFGSIVAIALAEMKYDVGAVDEADELLRGYSDSIEQFGYFSLIVAARVTRARVHMVRGEVEAGFAILERPLISAGELFDKLVRALNIERHYWLLRLGREEAPRMACSSSGLSLTQPPEPQGSSGAGEEARAAVWIQLARAGRRLDAAIAVAQKWQRYTEGVGAVRNNVRWHVALASLRILSEEPRLAMRHLRRAIKLGAGGQYRAAFLAELDLLREHLAILTDSDLEESEKTFVRSLIGVPKKQPAMEDAIELPLPLGSFTFREIAILRLVSKGHTNREIGATLGMTEGTVKWYLHKIYDMLGIRRRSQVAMLISQFHTKALDRGEESPFSDDD